MRSSGVAAGGSGCRRRWRWRRRGEESRWEGGLQQKEERAKMVKEGGKEVEVSRPIPRRRAANVEAGKDERREKEMLRTDTQRLKRKAGKKLHRASGKAEHPLSHWLPLHDLCTYSYAMLQTDRGRFVMPQRLLEKSSHKNCCHMCTYIFDINESSWLQDRPHCHRHILTMAASDLSRSPSLSGPCLDNPTLNYSSLAAADDDKRRRRSRRQKAEHGSRVRQ